MQSHCPITDAWNARRDAMIMPGSCKNLTTEQSRLASQNNPQYLDRNPDDTITRLWATNTRRVLTFQQTTQLTEDSTNKRVSTRDGGFDSDEGSHTRRRAQLAKEVSTPDRGLRLSVEDSTHDGGVHSQRRIHPIVAATITRPHKE